MARHIALLGDSIFDNELYVSGGTSVIEHVREILPSTDNAMLIALDGATVPKIFLQMESIPADATHLVLSVGGNDALRMARSVFRSPSSDIRSSLRQLAEATAEFKAQYRKLVAELRSLRRSLTICTVYDSIPGLDSSEIAGLCLFNDTITRTAFESGATLIDLRLICNEKSDYSTVSPIEPSVSGGLKIARAIMNAITDEPDFHRVVG